MPAMTLTEFLLARIAEDEAALYQLDDANAESDASYPPSLAFDCGCITADNPGAHVWDCTERLRAECEAKRQIVAALDMTPCPCQQSQRCVVHDSSAGPPEFARQRYADTTTDAVLAALTLPYADHPNYQPEWRP